MIFQVVFDSILDKKWVKDMGYAVPLKVYEQLEELGKETASVVATMIIPNQNFLEFLARLLK